MDMEKLKGFLGLADMKWEMTPSERLAVVALLELLRPRTALELGYRFGGCTTWLSRYCEEVLTVDIDEHVLESSRRFPNVTPLHMSSTEAVALLAGQGRTFDLVFVDADHSSASAARDLRGVLPLAKVILLHDTSNPGCRAGYLDALQGHDGYYDLDLVEGHVQVDGLWGGLGIVTTTIPGTLPSLVTQREPTYDLLVRRWREKTGTPGVQLSTGPAPSPRPIRFSRRLAKKLVGLLRG